MLVFIADWLRENYESLSFLRVFQFITVRAMLAIIGAFILSLLIGGPLIRLLKRLNVGQQIRKSEGKDARDLSEMHGGKSDTPTMGGLMIVFAIVGSTLLLCRLDTPAVWLMLWALIGFGAIGFLDDYLTLKYRNHQGLRPWQKLALEALFAAVFAAYLLVDDMGLIYEVLNAKEEVVLSESGYGFLCVPFFKYAYPAIGWMLIPFVIIVFCSSSNAVNMTDGLDGLAIGIMIIVALAFALITYLLGRIDFAHYLILPYAPQAGEISVIVCAVIGAGLGFLWFNSHPAEIFMGDTGSLALGGILSATAVLVKQEFLLVIIGGIFVIEALSVVIQVSSYKLRGKRVFRMAPLHHHFERGGLPESKIIIRFWIMAILFVLIGLGTLKLR